MKRIASFTPKDPDGCAYYRGLGVLGELRRYDIHVERMYGNVSWMELADCDIGFMQRPFLPTHLEIAKMIKQQMPLWIDYDDNLFCIPECNLAYRHFSDQSVQNNIKAIASLADVITVSTQALKNSMYSEKTIVIPNAYNDYRLPTNYEVVDRRHKVVLWRGSNSHVGDLLAFKKEIDALIAKHPDVRFVFLGSIPWMLNLNAANIDIVDEHNLYDYFRLIGKINPDVVIVPLEDSTFNECKSNVAWIEAARFGAQIVAPDWREWRRPGVHNYSNPSEFFSVVNDLLSKKVRDSAGWDYILENSLLSNINETRVNVIDQA